MRRLIPGRTDELVGQYGPGWSEGVITEHLHLADPAHVRTLANGDRVVLVSDRGTLRRAVPVVCSEVIEVPTEDDPVSGRCGLRVRGDDFACPDHMDVIASYAEVGA